MHNHKRFLRDNSKVMTKALALQIIQKAILTEKTSQLAQNNYISLLVGLKYNKCDIKKACEILYEQEIASIRIIVKKHKKKSFKGRTFIRSDSKKAFVKFKNTEAIQQLFGGQPS